MREGSAPEVEDRFMKKKTVGLMAAAGLVAGLVLAADVGARDQGRAERSVSQGGVSQGGVSQGGAPEPWFDGLGASIGASVRDATSAELTAAGVSQPGGAFVI